MEEKEQVNKRHGVAKTGRKAREDSKVKVSEEDRTVHVDSRGNAVIKKKQKKDRENKKAFAVMNVAKAKKKVAVTVDRQTSKHTFRGTACDTSEVPQLVAIVGAKNSGKSTLLRTLMRHYTGSRKHITGPVTVVSSKKRRMTLLECPNNLSSVIDVTKVADMILLMINVKQELQNDSLELIDIMTTHGAPRVRIIFTHLDEYPPNDKGAAAKMKLILKRLQSEIFAKPIKLTERKKMRDDRNSEYKIEEVRSLARFIGEKNPLPNAWRESHPYLLVDRIERVQSLCNDDTDCLKFYGFTRGCNMSEDIKHMHLMGVDDVIVKNISILNDPCPTPFQESKTKVKRQPLAMNERQAYAPMCGIGGVLKDADGFHIVSQGDIMDNEEDEDFIAEAGFTKSSLIKDLSDSEDSDSYEPEAKRRLLDDKDLAEDFDVLQSDMKIENGNMINYERFMYDPTYNCTDINKVEPTKDEDIADILVSGKWGDNEDASTLLKKDDENRRMLIKRSYKSHLEGMKKEVKDEEVMNEDEEEESMDDDEDIDEEDIDKNYDEEDMDDNDDKEDMDNNDDEDMDDNDEEDMDDNDEDIEEKNIVDQEGMNDDDSEEEYENDNEEFSGDEDEENEDVEKEDLSSNKISDDWVQDTANLTLFQKNKLEKDSKTKRQKTLEKKAKRKALFDQAYDEKTGGGTSTAFFDQWKANQEGQEKKNQEAFEHIDKESVHKFAGIKPGTYVSIDVEGIPKAFFSRFNATRPIILGGLDVGEEECGILTSKFKLHRHFKGADMIKTADPMCLSIGWRRIQTFCHFFKEEDNLRKTYLKYSSTAGIFCEVAFFAPIVKVNTGFVMFKNFEDHSNFRIVALGSVHSKNNEVVIKKKFKRLGYPLKVYKNTVEVTGMFANSLEVEMHLGACIKTTSGIRGLIKKPLNKDSGHFRATFEAPIFMADIIIMMSWVNTPMFTKCQPVSDLLVDKFEYLKPWNEFFKEKGRPAPKMNPDSAYKKIVRPDFIPAPIKINKKDINKLPFNCRPPEEDPVDLIQKNRIKVVLDVKESKRQQLFENIMETEKEKKQKMGIEKQKYNNEKVKKANELKEKTEKKEKEKSKAFFKRQSRNAPKKGGKKSKKRG